MIHKEASPLAGTTVTLGNGEEYRVEDYWDRVAGFSWKFAQGNPACLQYAIRTGIGNAKGAHIPPDDEVLYGKIGHFGHLIHVSEIQE